MPRRLAGAPARRTCRIVTRIYGLREIGTGIGLLTSKDPSPWLWARVAGDTLDIATVGAGMLVGRRPLRTLSSVAMLLGIAYVDMKSPGLRPGQEARRVRRARLQQSFGLSAAGSADARRRAQAKHEDERRRRSFERRRSEPEPSGGKLDGAVEDSVPGGGRSGGDVTTSLREVDRSRLRPEQPQRLFSRLNAFALVIWALPKARPIPVSPATSRSKPPRATRHRPSLGRWPRSARWRREQPPMSRKATNPSRIGRRRFGARTIRGFLR